MMHSVSGEFVAVHLRDLGSPISLRDAQMSSINTNAAAMTALQTLTQTNKMLTETQDRISTG